MARPGSLGQSLPALLGAAGGLLVGIAVARLLPGAPIAGWIAPAACGTAGYLAGYAREARRRLGEQGGEIGRLRQDLRLAQEYILSTGSFRSLGAWLDSTMEAIRQPLRDLTSDSRTVASDPALTEGTRRAAERLAERADEVRRVLGPLSTYSLTTPARAPFNLNNLLREAIDLCRHRAQERGIRFEERFSLVPPVFGPAGRIQSALLNVIVNAVEAMPHGGGTITVETSHEGEHVLARVRDSGIGVRPEHLGRVFDPFFTTKPDRSAAGLGLWEARHALDLIGAVVDLRSVPLQGTEVTLSFPQSAPLAAGRIGVDHPPELKQNTA